MDIGEFVDLLIHSPELAERIREAFYEQTERGEASGVDFGTWYPFATWNPDDFLDAAGVAPTELGEVTELIPALGSGTESWTRRLASP